MLITQKQIFRILMKIALKRNIIVKDCNLPDSVDGVWCLHGRHEIILLNYDQLQCMEKRNFVFAHELGHSALHKNTLNHALYKENNCNNSCCSIIEQEADEYAKSLIDRIIRGCFNE